MKAQIYQNFCNLLVKIRKNFRTFASEALQTPKLFNLNPPKIFTPRSSRFFSNEPKSILLKKNDTHFSF